jgi:hypothetical protein
MGTALDREEIREAAQRFGGTLPALFSDKRGAGHGRDDESDKTADGDTVPLLWTHWRDHQGEKRQVPEHVLLLGTESQRFALACACGQPITLEDGPFDTTFDYWTQYASGKAVANQQTAVLLKGTRYRKGFHATPVRPWAVELVESRPLAAEQSERIARWRAGDDWMTLVRSLRG